MNAVAEQDATAQSALVERLAARVLRVSRLLCRSEADAEDAAQLALLEILRSASGFRVEASLERWADRITARTALRVGRRERQRAQLLERWLTPGRFPWGTPLYTDENGRLGLDHHLARLSPRRREAFILRHALEYSVEEIAELTDARPGTVKDRLVHARKQLRAMLERENRKIGEGNGS
jgi:RNA polymerase sigma-70 factor (ECF subfamily)